MHIYRPHNFEGKALVLQSFEDPTVILVGVNDKAMATRTPPIMWLTGQRVLVPKF